MSRKLAAAALFTLLAPLSAAYGQSPAAQSEDPLVGSTRALYETTKGFLTKSAEQMPEADYAFRPVEGVRTFGELIGHIADAQYMFCSTTLGEASPSTASIEQTKKTRAELIEALKGSFTYCDRAYTTTSDAQATQIVNVFGNQRPKMFALNMNVAHNMEHYGNIVTYMRIKGMVPPSSQRGN